MPGFLRRHLDESLEQKSIKHSPLNRLHCEFSIPLERNFKASNVFPFFDLLLPIFIPIIDFQSEQDTNDNEYNFAHRVSKIS